MCLTGEDIDEIEVEIMKNDAFGELSRLLEGCEIFRWCDLKLDIIQVELNNRHTTEAAKTLREFLQNSGFKVVGLSTGDGTIEVALTCRCMIENSTVSRIEDMNGVPLMPVRYMGGIEHIRFLTFSGQDAVRIVESLRMVGTVKVTGKTQATKFLPRKVFTLSIEDVARNLTPRQIECFNAAFELGYYSIPKRVTIEDLASKLGMSRSTLQEHLRKAEIRLLSSIRPYLRMLHAQGSDSKVYD